MDPDANREEAARIRRRIRDGAPFKGDHGRLDELDEAYTNWIAKGGFRAKSDTR